MCLPSLGRAVITRSRALVNGRRLLRAHKIENMRQRLTILAYEMNGAPVSVLHGAPLRLRCENELGFKMVKWIEAIEFVRDFAHLGAGQRATTGTTNSMVTGCRSDAVSLVSPETSQSDGDHAVEVPDPIIILTGGIGGGIAPKI